MTDVHLAVALAEGAPSRDSRRLEPLASRPSARALPRSRLPQNSSAKFLAPRVRFLAGKFRPDWEGMICRAPGEGSGWPGELAHGQGAHRRSKGVKSSAAKASSGQAVSRSAPAPPKAALGQGTEREPRRHPVEREIVAAGRATLPRRVRIGSAKIFMRDISILDPSSH